LIRLWRILFASSLFLPDHAFRRRSGANAPNVTGIAEQGSGVTPGSPVPAPKLVIRI
jgi:hypothetical protein